MIRLALVALKNKKVLMHTGNTTMNVHMNKQRCTRFREAELLMQWAEKCLIGIKVEHLSSDKTLEVDWLGR